MSDLIKRVVIVGGGSAGWLTAAVLASRFRSDASGIAVTLLESPDVSTVGVGEGTWPSMCATLRKIGISETEFMRECDASFKQGSKFTGWYDGSDESYYHPFSLPQGFSEVNLAETWLAGSKQTPFSQSVSPQIDVCEAGLAPKQIQTPEYACNLNYAYHLDAGKFASLLQKHCTEKLGVIHVLDHMTSVSSSAQGDVSAVVTRDNGEIAGDIFVDCTGFASLLLGKHFNIPFRECNSVLFNDRALAVQVPYDNADDPIASSTVATAQRAGWIWDIALPSRRGIGHVYSSAHSSDDEAEADLHRYLQRRFKQYSAADVTPRKISFRPGYREKFWHRNCVAIGLSAGFLEPLEASALVLIELSAKMLAENMPATHDTMQLVANRFNEKFLFRWTQIIDFLKLHYVLSIRDDSDYWLDNRRVESIPQSLQDQLQLWRHRAPWHQDTVQVDEMFPAASYQYVLYGMHFDTKSPVSARKSGNHELHLAQKLYDKNRQEASKLVSHLPRNRELLNQLRNSGFAGFKGA